MTWRAGVLFALLAMAAPSATAQQLPALPTLHREVQARRADLVDQRALLARTRSRVMEQSRAFDTRCARVVRGSADDAWCAANFPTFQQQVLAHCSETTAFAAAYLAAIDGVLPLVGSQQALSAERLRGLRDQFLRESEMFEAQAVATQKGIDDAIAKIKEVTFLQLVAHLNDFRVDGKVAEIKRLLGTVRQSERVRALKSEAIVAAVTDLQARLKGKTAAQARKILIDHLNEERRILNTQRATVAAAVDFGVSSMKADTSTPEERSAEQMYSLLTAGIEAIGKAGTNPLNRAGGMMGIAGWVPTAIDGVVMAADAVLSIGEREDIDRLRRLAEEDRTRTAAKSDGLTASARELEALRPELRSLAAFACQ